MAVAFLQVSDIIDEEPKLGRFRSLFSGAIPSLLQPPRGLVTGALVSAEPWKARGVQSEEVLPQSLVSLTSSVLSRSLLPSPSSHLAS